MYHNGFQPPPPMAASVHSLSSSSVPLPPNNNMQNADAGPSTLAGQKRRRSTMAPKPRRTATTDSDGFPTDGPPTKTRDGPRKKKAARACFHCQKAHLTCDDTRPCQRCLKRGIADRCTEGLRKKAKYLLEDEELEALKTGKSTTNGTPENSSQLATSEPFPPGDPLFNLSFDPNFPFGSEAANLEYSILSAILGNPSHDQPHLPAPSPSSSASPFGGQQFINSWPADPPQPPRSITMQALGPQVNPYDSNLPSPQGSQFGQRIYEDRQMGIQPLPPQRPTSDFSSSYPSPAMQYGAQQSQMQQEQPEQYAQAFRQQQPQPRLQRQRTSHASPSAVSQSSSGKNGSVLISPPMSNASPMSSNSINEGGTNDTTPWNNQPEDRTQNVYDSVTKAYDYTEGYHFMMKFLPTRFDKNDILRVVRALAIFRPSLIALQTPLSEEDEVFVEKCFQRSLMELDKLISFSGTPTVVWRRTGEICLVGAEFCQLTEWDKDELIGGRKYIYELFENQSVVEYWEKFALHAFENTTQSVYSHCVLLKPSGEPVPCTFCFSIRRDIFDLPSVVIGQWLPLL